MVKENLGTRVRKFLADAIKPEDKAAPATEAEINPAQEPAVQKIYIKMKPIGTTGTESYAGYPSEEYLDELKGHRRARIFDKMWRSDSQSRMLYAAVVNVIKSATWEVEGTSDKEGDPLTPDQEKDRDLVHHILFNDITNPFDQFLTNAMTFVKHGHAYLEKTYKLVLNHPTLGTYHGIEGLDLISAKTIERFNLDKEKRSTLKSIYQLANGDLSSHIEIPAEFLIGIVLDREGSNYEGVSLFRPIYGNYFRKNFYQKMNGIGIEKHAVPAPTVTIPPGFQETPEFQNLIDALEAYCSGQSNFLIIPEGVVVSFEKNVYDPSKVDAAIDGEDRRAAKAFLANFLELGMASGGAFSLSNDLSDFFLSGLKQLAQTVAGAINTQLIPELITINRGPRSTYPKLTVSGIDDKAGKELAEILGILIDKKVVQPDDPMEVNMRKRYGLTKMSAEGRRDTTPPAPFGAPGAPHDPNNPNAPPPAPGAKPEDKGGNNLPLPKPEDKAAGKSLVERINKRLYG